MADIIQPLVTAGPAAEKPSPEAAAAVAPSLYIDPGGTVGPVPPEHIAAAETLGYKPASPEQAADYAKQQAIHEKYGTAGQAAITFAEHLASGMTLGGSTLAETKLLGVKPEDIKGRNAENPVAGGLGTATSIVAPLLLSGGLSAAAQGAAGAARTAVGLTAPALVAKAGLGAKALVGEALGAGGESAIGRIVAKALAAGAGTAVQSGAYALGRQVSEYALGDPNWTAQAALAKVGIASAVGFGTGAAVGAVWNIAKEMTPADVEQKLQGWLQNREAAASLRAPAGGANTKAVLDRLGKQKGEENLKQIGMEAHEKGLFGKFTSPEWSFEKSQELADSGAQAQQQILQQADRLPGATQQIAGLLDNARKEVLAPLASDPTNTAAATRLSNLLDSYGAKFKDGMSFNDLHEMRSQIGKAAWGQSGSSVPDDRVYGHALHDLYGLINHHMDDAIQSTPGLGKEALQAWKQANRDIEVGLTIGRIAAVGKSARAGNMPVSLTEQMAGWAGGLGGVMAGANPGEASELAQAGMGALGHAGIAGAASAAGMAMLRRHGSAMAADLARGAGNLLQGGLPPGAGQAAGTLAGSAPAAVIPRFAEKLIKSAVEREALSKLVAQTGDGVQQERATPGGQQMFASSSATIGQNPEMTALLSELQRTQDDIEEQIDRHAGYLVRGSPRAETTSRGEVSPGVGADFGKDRDAALKVYEKRISQVQLFQAHPEKLLDVLNQQMDGWQEHAPQTAAAMSTATSRAVAYLGMQIPQPPPSGGPLMPKWNPSRTEVANFNRSWEALDKPLSILKQGAAGTLTPQAVQAVQTVYPQLFEKMQEKMLEKMADHPEVAYRHRIMLSALMGQDMDGSLGVTMLTANKAVYAGPQPQAAPVKHKPSSVKPVTTLPQRSQTETQKAASRGEEP